MLRDEVAWIPLTRGRVTMVDKADVDLGRMRWLAAPAGSTCYAKRIEGRSSVYLHRIIARRAGVPIDGAEVDHINGNSLDNRRANLRAATRAQNVHNTGGRGGRSGIKGVSWFRPGGTWRARLNYEGKTVFCRYFRTKEDAARAYAEAARKYHGEFARTS